MRTYLFVILCINKLFNSIQFNGIGHYDITSNEFVIMKSKYDTNTFLNKVFIVIYCIISMHFFCIYHYILKYQYYSLYINIIIIILKNLNKIIGWKLPNKSGVDQLG